MMGLPDLCGAAQASPLNPLEVLGRPIVSVSPQPRTCRVKHRALRSEPEAAGSAGPLAAQAAILDVPFVDVFSDMSDPSLPLTTIEYEEWCVIGRGPSVPDPALDTMAETTSSSVLNSLRAFMYSSRCVHFDLVAYSTLFANSSFIRALLSTSAEECLLSALDARRLTAERVGDPLWC